MLLYFFYFVHASVDGFFSGPSCTIISTRLAAVRVRSDVEGRDGDTTILSYIRGKPIKRRNDLHINIYIYMHVDAHQIPIDTHTHSLTDSLCSTHTHTHGRVCSRTLTSSCYCTIIIVCV